MIRISSWNMAYWTHKRLKSQAWDFYLNNSGVDIFLFQEAHPPEVLKGDADHIIWNSIGQNRPWGSGIYSPRYKIIEEIINTQFSGAFVVANAEIDNQLLKVISLYGLMENSGPTKGYSIPNLHRMISDLTGLFYGNLGGRIILGGDMNASMQCDDQQWGNSHKIFFDRVEDFGLNDVFKLSGSIDYVQTLRHVKSKKPWQNDYFFISNSLKEKFIRYEIIDNEEVRKLSDHNILIIEIEL